MGKKMESKEFGFVLLALLFAVFMAGYAYTLLRDQHSNGVGSANLYVHNWQDVTVRSEQAVVQMELHGEAPYELVGYGDGAIISVTNPTTAPVWWNTAFEYYGYQSPTGVKPQTWEVDTDDTSIQVIVKADGRVSLSAQYPTWAIVVRASIFLIAYICILSLFWAILAVVDWVIAGKSQ